MIKKNKVSLVITTINRVSKNILNIESGCKKKKLGIPNCWRQENP